MILTLLVAYLLLGLVVTLAVEATADIKVEDDPDLVGHVGKYYFTCVVSWPVTVWYVVAGLFSDEEF